MYFSEQDDVKGVRCIKFSETFEEIKMKPECTEEDIRHEPYEDDQGKSLEKQENEEVVEERKETEDKRYSLRLLRKHKYLEDCNLDYENVSSVAKYSTDYYYHVADVPSTCMEAMFSSESRRWQEAMKEEMNASNENNTYELVPLPEGRTVVDVKWVHAIKLNSHNRKIQSKICSKGIFTSEGCRL